MAKSNIERKEHIIKNINYLIKSREETKLSFSERTNLTRASLYKILDGKVNNIQHSTVEKVATFFGTTCKIIESCDLEVIESQEKTMSLDGNKNPSAIPIIPESDFIKTLNEPIGRLVSVYPITYNFGSPSNTIAIRAENILCEISSHNSIIICRRNPSDNKEVGVYLFLSGEGRIKIKNRFDVNDNDDLVGVLIEERVL